MAQNNIRQIEHFGQSIWLDFFDRDLLNSGRLTRMLVEDGISGITSNPSIFEKAIDSGSDYDDDIKGFSQTQKTNETVFFDIAIKDMIRAADLLLPVFIKSNGLDGFVSLEVSPHLAYNTAKTIKQAELLWKSVARKNVMIKIPATVEGLPAIRKCISEGININITLLFGLPRYHQVADAYLCGLEDRVKAGKSIDGITSVASFFLSRIDAMVDPLLNNDLAWIKGKTAIASAKKAYDIYQEIFTTDRFKQLEIKNAKRQRLLWASTSTKDATFSDVKYVEALIGPETINTIPMETLKAFRNHGKAENRLKDYLENAAQVLEQLQESNIDLDKITQQLEDEGVQKFVTAYDNMLEAIEKKRQLCVIEPLADLTVEERDLLYQAPVLVSVLASCSLNKVNKIQKADAIKLAHLKTFTAMPLLIPYYKVVEKKFKTLFDAAIVEYYPFDEVKKTALKKELEKVNHVVEKLNTSYGHAIQKSLKKYASHVKHSTHSVFVDFIFPLPIPGLSN